MYVAQHTVIHCNTLQDTATQCNTLQHTATHYSTLSFRGSALSPSYEFTHCEILPTPFPTLIQHALVRLAHLEYSHVP